MQLTSEELAALDQAYTRHTSRAQSQTDDNDVDRRRKLPPQQQSKSKNAPANESRRSSPASSDDEENENQNPVDNPRHKIIGRIYGPQTVQEKARLAWEKLQEYTPEDEHFVEYQNAAKYHEEILVETHFSAYRKNHPDWREHNPHSENFLV